MLRIGLTGGIGSGKSTVAARLAGLGAVVVDADAISRQITAPGGAAIGALRAEFGDDVIGADGAMDRQRMRQWVFDDPDARRRLEAVLHPVIGDETRRQADAAQAAGAPAVVFDVPLLAESAHWRGRCDRILVVDCSEATQLARVQQRNGWPDAQVRQVIAQQAGRAQRRAIADAVIFNDGIDLPALHAAIDPLWQAWVGGH